MKKQKVKKSQKKSALYIFAHPVWEEGRAGPSGIPLVERLYIGYVTTRVYG